MVRFKYKICKWCMRNFKMADDIHTYVNANNTADIRSYKSVNIIQCYLLRSKMLNLT